MKKIALFIITILAFSLSINANNENGKDLSKESPKGKATAATCSLTGTIYDPQSDEFLSGATVVIDGKKSYSDLSGNFNIAELTQGKHTLTVDFVSYQSKTIEIDLNNSKELKIEMKQQ